MKLIGKLVIVVITCLLAVNAHALSEYFAVTPQQNQAGGLVFKITSERLADGGAKFRVVITENQTKLNSHPLAELGLVKITERARSIVPVRKPQSRQDGNALVCIFTASRQELANPDFCFVFSNPNDPLGNNSPPHPSRFYIFARLHEFVAHPRR